MAFLRIMLIDKVYSNKAAENSNQKFFVTNYTVLAKTCIICPNIKFADTPQAANHSVALKI